MRINNLPLAPLVSAAVLTAGAVILWDRWISRSWETAQGSKA